MSNLRVYTMANLVELEEAFQSNLETHLSNSDVMWKNNYVITRRNILGESFMYLDSLSVIYKDFIQD